MLLGIDLGTSSVKAAVMTDAGLVKDLVSAGYLVSSPATGWAETDPADWWQAVRKAVGGLAAEHRRSITAVGLSGQMHGVVLTNEDGRPARPAILWPDGRAVAELQLYRSLSPRLRGQLVNEPAKGMAGPSLLWLKRCELQRYETARWALQPKDWLRMQLTSEVRSEPTDASATLMFDFQHDTWSNDVLGELGIRPGLLPDLVASAAPAGNLTETAARELGIAAGVPVAAGAADAAASLLGHGILEPGRVLLTIGTGAQVSSVRTSLQPDRVGRTQLHRTIHAGKWYSMAAVLNAGLALDWVRGLFGVDWATLYRSASAVPAGAGGVSFLPYLVGERMPRLDSSARAGWLGIGLNSSRDHLLKAALEGVAFSLRDAVEAIEASGIPVKELHVAGGGALDGHWRQMLADVVGKCLIAASSPAGAPRGAAILAGLASGLFKSAAPTLEVEVVAEPGPDADAYVEIFGRYRALTSAAADP